MKCLLLAIITWVVLLVLKSNK